MKGRIIIGSVASVFLILFVPLTDAFQIQTIRNELPTTLISNDLLKNMDADELIVFIRSLAKDYPELFEEFQRSANAMENIPVSSMSTKHDTDISVNTNPGSEPKNDNQTVLEKIFWKIYNYRVFRLLVSTLLFIKFQSKFTLMRTMTWGIRLLRWVKIGILLGFIDPSQQPPQTPNIAFEEDLINKTLTVISVDSEDVPWIDIAEIGAGSCDLLPVGNVTVGDTLTSCTGIIVLQYIPSNTILGVFEFE